MYLDNDGVLGLQLPGGGEGAQHQDVADTIAEEIESTPVFVRSKNGN